MPKLTIDGTAIEVPPGRGPPGSQARARDPRFCYHERLSAPAIAACAWLSRRSRPKPIASCTCPPPKAWSSTPTPQVARPGKGDGSSPTIRWTARFATRGECDLQDQAWPTA